jgi:predicted ATP-grasp superfamily ATP-dependent carboligase
MEQLVAEVKQPRKKPGVPAKDLSAYLKPGETTHENHPDGLKYVTQETLRKRKFDKNEKETKRITIHDFNSSHELPKKDALEVLAQRIQNAHVRETVYELGKVAAEHHHIPMNEFYWKNGLQCILASRQTETLFTPQPKQEVPNEVCYYDDIYALYDYGMSWREPITFQEFLALRYMCKTDVFQLGLTLGKDFREFPEGPHGAWRDFFVRFNPTLRPGYTQEDMKQWLDQQSPIKDRLLLASRNSYKSSFDVVWLITAVLSCPDIRLLIVSETKDLSKGFIRGFRQYFEVLDKRQPTRFQQLFPEHTIVPDDGSVLNFESPMRTLGLIQYTAASTSMDSTVAGQRADIIVYDDPISDKNTGNEEQRQKGVDIFDSTQKLREVGGFTQLIGTPWSVEDLYATLIRRTHADEVTPESEKMQIRIDPAWTVKPEVKAKRIPLHQLKEQDVELLFPSRLSWKFLQKELRANEIFFRSQNLCEFVSEDDQIKVTFVEDDLRRRLKPADFFDRAPRNVTVLAVDPAFSVARYADFSALAVIRIHQYEDRMIAFVIDVHLERLKQSELGTKIVETISRFQCDRVVVEKSPNTNQDLAMHIQYAAMNRQVALPYIYWKSPQQGGIAGASMKAKTARIKGLEVLLAENRLYFQYGSWNEVVFNQFVKFDGVSRSSNTRKDDAPDAIALGCEIYMPRYTTEVKSAVQREAEEQQRLQAALQQQYNHIFQRQDQQSSPAYAGMYPPGSNPGDDNPGPLYKTLDRFGMRKRAA